MTVLPIFGGSSPYESLQPVPSLKRMPTGVSTSNAPSLPLYLPRPGAMTLA